MGTTIWGKLTLALNWWLFFAFFRWFSISALQTSLCRSSPTSGRAVGFLKTTPGVWQIGSFGDLVDQIWIILLHTFDGQIKIGFLKIDGCQVLQVVTSFGAIWVILLTSMWGINPGHFEEAGVSSPWMIHGTGIFFRLPTWMVDFYGFHVGKYTCAIPVPWMLGETSDTCFSSPTWT